MKILYKAPLDSVHSRRWLSYFVEKGHDVHVLWFGEEKLEFPGVTIHTVKSKGRDKGLLLYYLTDFRKVKRKILRIIDDINPDIIHIHNIDFNSYFIVKNKNVPVVVTAWGSDVLVSPNKSIVSKYALKGVLRGSDVITCDADHLKDAMVKFGAQNEKIKIIFFGTNMECFNPKLRDPNLAKELGFEENSKLIISLRALRPIYDISTFVRAIPLILKEYSCARFVIVGDGEEREKLINLVDSLGVTSKVKFAGRLSDEDMQRYTASADIYVSTSLSDGGLAASTAESMASRVPVVITDFGNNKDWVKNGESGFLFPLKDYKMLAKKVLFLLQNEKERDMIAEAGRMVIDERNNYHREMGKVELLYKKILGIE